METIIGIFGCLCILGIPAFIGYMAGIHEKDKAVEKKQFAIYELRTQVQGKDRLLFEKLEQIQELKQENESLRNEAMEKDIMIRQKNQEIAILSRENEKMAKHIDRFLAKQSSCNGNCGLNHCDTNGCQERVRHYVDGTTFDPSNASTDNQAKELTTVTVSAGTIGQTFKPDKFGENPLVNQAKEGQQGV